MTRRLRIPAFLSHGPLFLVAGILLLVTACDEVNGPDMAEASPRTSMMRSQAGFVTWHQGFELGSDGWYDATEPGPLGWCGLLEVVDAHDGNATVSAPSAGRHYATASLGLCNEYWTGVGIPVGGPYAPGPEAILYSTGWPEAGYVTELDLYLDPSWSDAGYQSAFSALDPPPYSSNSIITLGATIFEDGYVPGDLHNGPHWFARVEIVPGQEALRVGEHRIEEAGWYTFRFAFSDRDGVIGVELELRNRRGGVVGQVPVAPTALFGPYPVPFPGSLRTDDYVSGHIWFFDIAPGLELPIDEHRVRPGR